MRTTEFGDLIRRDEKGEAAKESLSQTEVSMHVEEYAKAFGLSWRAIVNDDLGEIARFPNKLLKAAVRFENKFVSALYDNATSQAAMVALGSNYYQALSATAANLMTAWEAFMEKTDAKGNPISVTPKYLVTHPTKKLVWQEILAGIDVSNNLLAKRATAGLLEWVGDPYMGDTNDWWLFADPSEIPSVTVLRLRGYETPRVYLKAADMVPFSGQGAAGQPSWLTGNFEHGEIEFQVLDVIGGWDDSTYEGITDYFGVFYSNGGS